MSKKYLYLLKTKEIHSLNNQRELIKVLEAFGFNQDKPIVNVNNNFHKLEITIDKKERYRLDLLLKSCCPLYYENVISIPSLKWYHFISYLKMRQLSHIAGMIIIGAFLVGIPYILIRYPQQINHSRSIIRFQEDCLTDSILIK